MRVLLLRLAALLFCGATICAQAEWQITNSERELSPNKKVAHWRTTLANSATGESATLHRAVFETKAATLRLIDQPSEPRRDLAAVMNASGAIAGVNGGYFDPDDAPVGLLVSEGRPLAPLRKAKLLSGVLSVTGGRVEILRSGAFRMSAKVKNALQCGPMLVDGGTPVAGLNDSRRARRTFAAVDGKGHVVLGVSSALSLAELAKILALTNSTDGMQTVRALNLDGGSSSAFWFRGADDFSIPELKTVRDFVAIVPLPGR